MIGFTARIGMKKNEDETAVARPNDLLRANVFRLSCDHGLAAGRIVGNCWSYGGSVRAQTISPAQIIPGAGCSVRLFCWWRSVEAANYNRLSRSERRAPGGSGEDPIARLRMRIA
jgi:hypothetical protein